MMKRILTLVLAVAAAQSSATAHSPAHIEKPEQDTCESIEQHLTQWMRHQTDLIIPD